MRLLKGGGSEIIAHYKSLMMASSDNMEFEKAQIYKEKMLSLENHYSKSIIVGNAVGDVVDDVADGVSNVTNDIVGNR